MRHAPLCWWFKSQSMWEKPGQPCHIHAYTVYTPIGGKGRCHTSCDLQDHNMQARKHADEISTLDFKLMRKDTRSPKQEQSVAPQNGPWSKQKFIKKKKDQFLERGTHWTLHKWNSWRFYYYSILIITQEILCLREEIIKNFKMIVLDIRSLKESILYD